MILKKMTKKDWIIYSIRMIVFIIVWFGLAIYKENKVKTVEQISATDITPGIYDIFTSHYSKCGYINITKEEDCIVIGIYGEKIKDINILDKPYTLKPIEYDSFVMKTETIGKESFYICNSEESVILLLKVRNQNSFFIKNYSLKKNESLYMFCEISRNKYERFLLEYEDLEIQNRCYANIDTNRYTCFFIQ